jgi:hypothetical protein
VQDFKVIRESNLPWRLKEEMRDHFESIVIDLCDYIPQ